jgi:2-polyprenyl-6-methoxyphenol hydroxylase-like FAD-dependent oxidoreductase
MGFNERSAMDETPKTISCRCCIVGGGPAGMMLGFLLARAGVDTIVLEKHADFLRDFRGDTIHPSTLEAMHDLGLLDDFLKLPHQEVRQGEVKIGDVTIPMVDFSHLPVHAKFVALMPQWDFLDFLADRAKQYPCFRLLMSAEVEGLIGEEGKVAGVTAKTKDGQLTIRADLTIGADGRHSLVRREAGFVPLDIGAPMDALWFRLSRGTSEAGMLLGRVDAGQILVVFNRGEYWQCAYVIAKGSTDRLKTQGISSLRHHISALAPFLADRVAELESFDDVKLLTVAVDRLPLWHKPGLLCIGDAAHAMSPVGGVGINLAIQDGIAAANILSPALRGKGPLSDRLLAQVQKRREWPTKVIQAVQVVVQKRIISRVLGSTGKIEPPRLLRLFIAFPILRRLPARLMGLGVRRERVTSPVLAEAARMQRSKQTG